MPTDDEWAEADMMADEAHGKPLKRTPEEGIRDMERRIASTTQRLRNLHPDAQNPEIELQLIKELREAKARLKEYQIQLDERN